MPVVLNIASYKFVALPEDRLETIRSTLKQRALQLDIRGTILLSCEGINLFLAGDVQNLPKFQTLLSSYPEFSDLVFKNSWTNDIPFNRLIIKIKPEIITFRQPSSEFSPTDAPRISPKDLKRWLDQGCDDEGKEVLLLDTRNSFEFHTGTFCNAIHPNLERFTQYPEHVEALNIPRDRTIVTFCTGGIRCEKAAPWMRAQGYQHTYQLDGGILRYFEECQDAHFEGECFVFDKRCTVDPQLNETDTELCFACWGVVTAKEQRSPHYKIGQSCPKCHPKNQPHPTTKNAPYNDQAT